MTNPTEINILIADVLVDLLDSATIFRSFIRRPKTIFALQDYLTTYLLPRTTQTIREKIWTDQVLSHIVWRMLIGYPQHQISEDYLSQSFLLSEGKLECKYYANRKSILDFINNKSDKWWTRLSKVWIKKTAKYIERFVVKHIAVQKQRVVLEQLLLPTDINIQIMAYIVDPIISPTLYV